MLYIRKDLCDNSTYCWFLTNCRQNVVSMVNRRIRIDAEKCVMCRECIGHCDVSALYETEDELNVVRSNLNQINTRFTIGTEIFGAEPSNQGDVIFGTENNEYDVEATMNAIRLNNDKLQLVELICNRSLICEVAGVPFTNLFDDMRENIACKYNGEIMHEIIYTGNNEVIFNKFLQFFGVAIDDMERVTEKSPLLFFYNQGKCLGYFGYGPLHYQRYDNDVKTQLKRDVTRIMENYGNGEL